MPPIIMGRYALRAFVPLRNPLRKAIRVTVQSQAMRVVQATRVITRSSESARPCRGAEYDLMHDIMVGVMNNVMMIMILYMIAYLDSKS